MGLNGGERRASGFGNPDRYLESGFGIGKSEKTKVIA